MGGGSRDVASEVAAAFPADWLEVPDPRGTRWTQTLVRFCSSLPPPQGRQEWIPNPLEAMWPFPALIST